MPDNSQLEAPSRVTIYRNPAKAAVIGYKISQYCISQKGRNHLATGHLFSVICILRGQRCLSAAVQPTLLTGQVSWYQKVLKENVD